jgi:LPXTG-motif cell wall-anchored protein
VFVGGTGGGGGGGDLPVTGVQAGLIGGVGLAVLAGGGALLVMSRRRKVVLVTPGDETPTA